MARSVSAATSGGNAGLGSRACRSTSPWTSVESTSITTSRRPCRSRPTALTATSTRCAAASRASTLAQPADVGAGDVELDGRDRVAGHPDDAVDVRAGVGDPAGDGRDRSGRNGRPSTVTCTRPPRRRSLSPSPRWTSTSMPRSGAVLLTATVRASGSCGAATRMLSTSRSRSTLCSMSSTSTSKSARVEIDAVSPGRSGPVASSRIVGVDAGMDVGGGSVASREQAICRRGTRWPRRPPHETHGRAAAVRQRAGRPRTRTPPHRRLDRRARRSALPEARRVRVARPAVMRMVRAGRASTAAGG